MPLIRGTRYTTISRGASRSTPPTITSSATPSVVEGNTAVVTVTATGGQTPYTFSIPSGTDAALFSINSSTGALAFLVAPDFAAPGDSGANNIYDLTVRVASVGGAYVEQAVAVTVTPAYVFRLVSSRQVYQGTDESTPAGVGDPVRRANNQGTLGGDAQAPNDGARPTRETAGFRFGSGKYLDLGTSTSLQPAKLRFSCTVTRRGSLSGIDSIFVWAKANADFTSNGWYLQLNGNTSFLLFYTDGVSFTDWNLAFDTVFPLNTPVELLLTFDATASPKAILKIAGATQTPSTQTASTITATSANKYFGYNSPGYNSGFLENVDIENPIIHSDF